MAVSKSTDAGANWHRDTLTTTYGMCYALRVDRSNSNVVYAGGYNGALYKSTDAGSAWFLSNTGLTGTVYDIAIGSSKANTIYLGSTAGVFKSTNAGTNWTNTGCTNVNAVLINPTNESEIYAATTVGVYKSTTGGGGWTLMNAGLSNTYTTSLGIYADNYVFVGTDGTSMYRWNIMVGAEESQENPGRIILSAQPNPSRGNTSICFQIKNAGQVNLTVYDAQGRIVKQILNSRQAVGIHTVAWDGRDETGIRVADGIYFCKLVTENNTDMKKVVIIQ